jgi:hypothetical protein
VNFKKTPRIKKPLHRVFFTLPLFVILILSGMIFPIGANETTPLPAITEETIVLEQNFDGLTELPEGWIVHYGNWSISDGKLCQSYQPEAIFDDFKPAMLTFGENLTYLEKFRFEATLQFESSLDYWSLMGLGFDMHDPDPLTGTAFYWETSRMGVTFLSYLPDTDPIFFYPNFVAFGTAPNDMSDGQAVQIKLEVYGEYGDIYFNDDLVVANAVIPRWGSGSFGLFMGFGGTGSYDNIKITALPFYPPSILTKTLLNGTVGLPYIQKLSVEGDKLITYSQTSGTLPAGLSLSSDGVISGTPTASGTFTFTIKAENAKGEDSKELDITINDYYASSFVGRGTDFSSRNIELVSIKKLSASPKTFEAWIKMPLEYQGAGVIAGNGAIDGFNGLATINFGITADGNPWLYWKEMSGNVAEYIAYANVKLGDWVHIAIVQDSENHKLICYINGIQADEQIFSIMEDTIPIRPLKIGGDYLADNIRCFPGEIADIRIWSEVRTQLEIQTDMNIHLSGNEAGLIANWLLDNEIGGVYKDNSAQGNDAHVWYEWIDPEFAEGDYTIVVIPDIQYLTLLYPDDLVALMEWIRDNAIERNIQFVIQVGDLTDTNSVEEWELVQDNLAKLDGIVPFFVPYVFIPGNHDYEGMPFDRNTTLFNTYLPYNKYSQTSIFGGAYEDNKLDNAYYYFTTDDMTYLMLCLEIVPRDPVIDWANTVVADNSDCQVIVVTHAYLSYNADYDSSSAYDPAGNSGKEIWDKLVSQHPNIIMVLCGHIHYDDLVIRTDSSIYGNMIPQLLVDAQDMDLYREGVGMVALLTFSNNGHDVAINWYSTKMNALFRDWNQFSFSVAIATHTITFDTMGGYELPMSLT